MRASATAERTPTRLETEAQLRRRISELETELRRKERELKAKTVTHQSNGGYSGGLQFARRGDDLYWEGEYVATLRIVNHRFDAVINSLVRKSEPGSGFINTFTKPEVRGCG